jgi:hypothetical protein
MIQNFRDVFKQKYERLLVRISEQFDNQDYNDELIRRLTHEADSLKKTIQEIDSVT